MLLVLAAFGGVQIGRVLGALCDADESPRLMLFRLVVGLALLVYAAGAR